MPSSIPSCSACSQDGPLSSPVSREKTNDETCYRLRSDSSTDLSRSSAALPLRGALRGAAAAAAAAQNVFQDVFNPAR